MLIALLVFLVSLAPLGWLFTRMRHDAILRDHEKLGEFAASVRKALSQDGQNHQRMMQTWRKRIDAVDGPLDHKAWSGILDGPKSMRLGRFRAVGYAQFEKNGRLIVRFCESREPHERIGIGTDLASLPEFRASLEVENSAMRGGIICADSVDLLGIGMRNLVFNRTSSDQGGNGVIFASVLAEDFLAPVETVWKNRDTLGSGDHAVIQKDFLPGVGEGQVWIQSIPPGGKVPGGNLPEFSMDNGMGGLHLVFHPGPKFPESSLVYEASIVLWSGGCVALLLSIIAWIQAGQRDRLQTQVADRTTELRESNATLGLYKAIVETTSDLVALCEIDGTVISMNQSGRAMLGIGPDESLAALLLDRCYSAESMQLLQREGFPHAFAHGSWSAEVQMCDMDGHEFPVSFVGVVIKSSESVPKNLGCIARDITARREMDRQLQDSLTKERELVKMKSLFVNTVSHEFRTPLGVILSSADILTHYLDRLPADQRIQHLRDIHDSSQHMSRMLEQILSLAGLESGKSLCNAKPLDLSSLLQRIVDENRSANGGKVALIRESSLEGATADEGLLRHILLNLLSNARKYSPDDAPVEFSARRESGDVIFTVRDHGIGIPAGDLPHIFEAFTRAGNVEDAPGTGLGLAIVQRCVAMHGGTIHLESQAGEGTTVSVRLPIFTTTQT